MDASKNRYELLFMDDESNAPVEIVAKTKTQSVTASKKTQERKKVTNVEKENKANVLNKSETPKIIKDGSNSKSKQGATATNRKNVLDDSNHTGTLKKNNDELRDQYISRRNPKEGRLSNVQVGESHGIERTNRQFRDRDNRGSPRIRLSGENNVFRGGKREFDRQSGSDKTGVKSVDKREGAGAHNWGSVKQDIEDLNKATGDNETALNEELPNEQNNEQPTTVEDEEAKEMTLDEWKAMQQQRCKPQFNIRKAGEGEDTTQWKKMIVLNKKKEGDSEEELEYDPSMYPQRVGRLQRIVDIQFNFNDGRRGPGNGGFGRGRGPKSGDKSRFEGSSGTNTGRGNTGRPRNIVERRGGQNSLKVDDERQFPTLN